MIVRFRYSDLLMTARIRPAGYMEEVLRIGWRKGPEVCMSQEAYRMLCLKYNPGRVVTDDDAPRIPVDGCCGKATPALTH
jgi:hypothetical protein